MRVRTPQDLAGLARGRRTDRGWTQAEVADRVGVSRKWVSDFERGKSSVDLASVLRLLDALGVTLESVTPGIGAALDPGDAFDLDDFLAGYRQR